MQWADRVKYDQINKILNQELLKQNTQYSKYQSKVQRMNSQNSTRTTNTTNPQKQQASPKNNRSCT